MKPGSISGAFTWLIMGLIRVYRFAISSWMPPVCRFHPSCSRYALIALERHGLLRGGWLATTRVLRCHPFNPGGFDPVPPLASEAQAGDPMTAEQPESTRGDPNHETAGGLP